MCPVILNRSVYTPRHDPHPILPQNSLESFQICKCTQIKYTRHGSPSTFFFSLLARLSFLDLQIPRIRKGVYIPVGKRFYQQKRREAYASVVRHGRNTRPNFWLLWKRGRFEDETNEYKWSDCGSARHELIRALPMGS